MARMVPFPMLPTESAAERRLYEAFLERLPDEYVVYHSVDWVLAAEDAGGAPVQGECDFLISHPVDGILVLEVKGGRIGYDPATRRWTTTGHQGTHALDEDPFHQARDEMTSLLDILRAQPGFERWRPSYGYAVAFPDGTYRHDAHPGAPASIVVDHDDLGRLPERIREIMRGWRRPGRTFGAEGMEALALALALALGRRVEIRTSLATEFAEEDRRIVELTDEQQYVLSFLTHLRRAAVVGPAGCGKTLLAVQTARRLAGQGRPTLLTCFNRRLATDLVQRTRGTAHLDVAHFHGLCVRLAREAGLEVPAPPGPLPDGSPYFEEILPGLLAQAAARLGPRYHAMVVDEAQDLHEAWWPPLLALLERPEEGPLYVFADDHQNLYGGRLPLGPEDPRLPLPHNLRNTRSIHEFVAIFYQGKTRARSRGPEGRPVEVLGYRDEDDLVRLLALVVRNLLDEGVRLDDIVLLTPARTAKSPLRSRGRVDGIELSERPEPGKLLASTVHAFKGLERPVVILAEVEDHHQEDFATYLYVGGSRARNHLVVLAAEQVAADIRRRTAAAGP